MKFELDIEKFNLSTIIEMYQMAINIYKCGVCAASYETINYSMTNLGIN